jgi:isoquinoline 1-oxidoreductase subunit beta
MAMSRSSGSSVRLTAACTSSPLRSKRRFRVEQFSGLTAALYGSITFKDGRAEQSNFDSYLPMRSHEVPVVETRLIKNTEAPGGIGEAPTVIVSAEVTNAIFAATGKRLRSLPIDTDSPKSSS